MCLKCEPSSELLHISAKYLFSNSLNAAVPCTYEAEVNYTKQPTVPSADRQGLVWHSLRESFIDNLLV